MAITQLPLIVIDNLIPRDTAQQTAFMILVMGIFIIAISNGALTILFSMVINRQEPDIKICLKQSLNYLPKMIVAIMLYGMCIVAGVLCFIIPGIIIGARLSLYNYYIIYENMDPVAALKQSFSATQGFTFEVTSLFVFIFFIATIPYLIVANYLYVIKITNPLILVASDFIFSVIGTLVLVLTFRIYCMIKEKNGIYLN